METDEEVDDGEVVEGVLVLNGGDDEKLGSLVITGGIDVVRQLGSFFNITLTSILGMLVRLSVIILEITLIVLLCRFTNTTVLKLSGSY